MLVICLKQGANDPHMDQLMPLPTYHLLLHKNAEWLAFMVPAYLGCPGKEAIKQVTTKITQVSDSQHEDCRVPFLRN